MSDFTERLKQIRDEEGVSQREMSKIVGVSIATWQTYESGRSSPGSEVLEALAKRGFNINWLLTGIGPMKLQEEEIKRLLCEQAHNELRGWVRSVMSNPARLYEIPGLTYEEVKAYAKARQKDGPWLTKEQLKNLCYRAKGKFDSDKFLSDITSVDMSVVEATRQFQKVDEKLLSTVLEAVESYLNEIGGNLTATKKGQLVTMLYEMFYAEEVKKVDKATVIRLVKLAA